MLLQHAALGDSDIVSCGILDHVHHSVSLADDVVSGAGVVDNNSTDETRRTVNSYIAAGHRNLTYLFEPKQGVSHARNCGVKNARAPIIAF